MASIYQRFMIINRAVSERKVHNICLKSSQNLRTFVTSCSSSKRFFSQESQGPLVGKNKDSTQEKTKETQGSQVVKNEDSTQDKTKDDGGERKEFSTMELTRVYASPSNFNKLVLVLAGKYESKAAVPEKVAVSTINAAWDKMRVICSLYLLVATFVCCIVTIKVGQWRTKKHYAAITQQQEEERLENIQRHKEAKELAENSGK